MKDALWLPGSGIVVLAIAIAAMTAVIRLDRPAQPAPAVVRQSCVTAATARG